MKECQICGAESPCHLAAKSLSISRLTKNRKTAIVFAYSDQVNIIPKIYFKHLEKND
jgi:hypothetical protein